MNIPRVSVAIPTHDRPEFLERSLKSVLGSTYEDFEIVVSEDGSVAQSEGIVRTLGDTRVRYTRLASGAFTEADDTREANWQNAAELSRGEFFFKLDDDDEISPAFLERCVAFLDRHPECVSVYTGYIVLRDDGWSKEMVDRHYFKMGMVDGQTYARSVLTGKRGIPINQKTAGFYRRRVAEQIGYYRNAGEDFLFSSLMAMRGDIGYIPEVLYRYHNHEGNTGHEKAMWRSLREIRKTQESDLDGLQPEHAHLYRKWLKICETRLPAYYVARAAYYSRWLAIVVGWKGMCWSPRLTGKVIAAVTTLMSVCLPRRTVLWMTSWFRDGGQRSPSG